MFSNIKYLLLSGLFEHYNEEEYPYVLNYAFRSPGQEKGEANIRSEEFYSYGGMEEFIMNRGWLTPDFFHVLWLPDTTDYGSVAAIQAAVNTYLHEEEAPGGNQPPPASQQPPAESESNSSSSDNNNKRRKKKQGGQGGGEELVAAAGPGPIKLVYDPFDDSIPEGEEAKQVFLATQFEKLQRNFKAVTNKDPFFPPNRNITIRDKWGAAGSKLTLTVNQEFWVFALKEFEAHQRARILRGEERSNCFRKGASASWRKCDLESTLVNAVVVPPKKDVYKPALGTK